jgi:ankyrin repeat protein
MKNFSHYFLETKSSLNLNSVSNRNENNLLSKSKSSENSTSSIRPFYPNDIIFHKKRNNSISKLSNEQTIKIENKKINVKELKSIFKLKDNTQHKLSYKKPIDKNILKLNILFIKNKQTFNKKDLIRNNNELVKLNKDFLNFVYENNNINKIKEIENKRKNIINDKVKEMKTLYKDIKKEYEIKNKPKTNTNFYFKSIKNSIFLKKNNIIENHSLNITTIVYTSKFQIKIERCLIQYLSSKYKIKNIINIFCGINHLNKKSSSSSILNKSTINPKLLNINIDKELNISPIQNKNEKFKRNNYSKLSSIEIKEYKRKSQINLNNFSSRYSLLNINEFFDNKKRKSNNKDINNNNRRRKSLFKRAMYTIINRRKSITKKNLLTKEDFALLKSLIETKKENQFIYEFHRFINMYDINSSDNNGNTLLTYSCMNGSINIVKYLLNNGANPNCINIYKNTPLHYALSNKYFGIADLLMKNKANDSIKNIYGSTPW